MYDSMARQAISSPTARHSNFGGNARTSADFLRLPIFSAWIVAGRMTPRQDPRQESSSVPATGQRLEGELHRLVHHDTVRRLEVNRHRQGPVRALSAEKC
jgi:hypothetical protein